MGRSSRMGFPHLPHFGCCPIRDKSTRFSVSQNGQATVALRLSFIFDSSRSSELAPNPPRQLGSL